MAENKNNLSINDDHSNAAMTLSHHLILLLEN